MLPSVFCFSFLNRVNLERNKPVFRNTRTRTSSTGDECRNPTPRHMSACRSHNSTKMAPSSSRTNQTCVPVGPSQTTCPTVVVCLLQVARALWVLGSSTEMGSNQVRISTLRNLPLIGTTAITTVDEARPSLNTHMWVHQCIWGDQALVHRQVSLLMGITNRTLMALLHSANNNTHLPVPTLLRISSLLST